VIPKGTEADYTGKASFDASAEAAGDWASVADEITGNAQELSAVTVDAVASQTYSVSFTGTVTEYNTDSPKGYLVVTVDGVSEEVRVQVGSVFGGTTVRDAQTVKAYEDFTNQTEWSEYAKTINSEVQTNVIDPLGDLAELEGKTVEVIGCYTPSGDTIVITPVSLTAQ
jgi:predicted lipoprotein